MLYFIVGDGVPFELKSRELIQGIKDKNNEISIHSFDFSQDEDTSFLDNISQFSIFQTKKLYIVKRIELFKNFDKFLKKISQFITDDKEIIFHYQENFDQYGRRDDEKDKASQEKKKKFLSLLEETGKLYIVRTENLKKSALQLITSELNIDDKLGKELLNLIGDDYFIIKNEINKIKNFLGNDSYSLDKIKGIISVKKDFSIIKGIEKLLAHKEDYELQQWLSIDKEYIQFIYVFFEELLIYYKLTLLVKEGKLYPNPDYNAFKSLFSTFESIFINDKTNKPMHSYSVFSKFSLATNYESSFLLKKIKALSLIDYKIKSGTGVPEIELPLFLSSFHSSY